MKNLQILKTLTMTSRDIADLTGKQHSHVMRDIGAMFEALDLSTKESIQEWTHPQNKQTYTEYLLDKDLTLTLLLGYDTKARFKVVKRWQALEEKELESQNAIIDRQHSRLESPELTAALKESRALEGKDTLNRHYINEYNLLNRLVLGTTAKKYIEENGFSPSTAIRDTMRPVEIKAMAELQRVNTSLIEMGLDYPARKPLLIELYNRKFKQPLIDEVLRIES